MGDTSYKRRLAAILAADVVGYSAAMEADEDATVAAWKAARTEINDPKISEHRGRIVKHTGDGFLAEFDAVSDAVNCAVKNISNPIRVYAIRLEAAATASVSVDLAIADKAAIAVLPFDNMSGDPAQDFIGDGLAEDIISGLSRIRSFFVIARNSTFQYKGTSPDIRRVAEELGVRYVLEGSVHGRGIA